MKYPIGSAIIAVLACPSCSSRPASQPAISQQPVPELVRVDSNALCTVRTTGQLLNIRCRSRDHYSDRSRMALVLDRTLICPTRSGSDTIPTIAPERLRAIHADSIVSIETVDVVPESIQRRCSERLQRVIYVITK